MSTPKVEDCTVLAPRLIHLGWMPGDAPDWTVRGRHCARLYDGARELAHVHARWRWLLTRRMAQAQRSLDAARASSRGDR